MADLSLEQLKGVGPKIRDKLSRLHIHSLLDLVFHLPLRYEDRTRIVPVAGLIPGQRAVIDVRFRGIRESFGARRSLIVSVGDDTGTVAIRLFHYSRGMRANLERAHYLRCFGEPRPGPQGLEMVHPEITLYADEGPALDTHLTPIYPTTEGLNQKSLAHLIDQARAKLRGQLPELIPESLRTRFQMIELETALDRIHRPSPGEMARFDYSPERSRLVIEELLAHRLALLQRKDERRNKTARRFTPALPLKEAFLKTLPFSPTAAQARVVAEVEHDLKQPEPMHRLVQGDVGSGKTLVAVLSALPVLSGGAQVAVMAPTEILAEQHLKAFSNWLAPFGLKVGWLSGAMKAREKKDVLAALAEGQINLLVGTHALFQKGVEFHELGLVIVDEQHRFGVHQRLALTEKNDRQAPHQLIMTATPIPRTLAMSLYADLDRSVIDELPPGRTPIETRVMSIDKREAVAQRIRALVAEGGQVYWICTLVEISDKLDAEAAEAAHAWLSQALPELKIGLVHGRMDASAKQAVMAPFAAGDVHVLVATTVIEVGVDVPNANLMVIENAERLGLAQLHQLRGRVGRGQRASFCLLLYGHGLSENGKARLETLRASQDGWVIAEKDLELRGPGDLMGTRQTGELSFRVANLSKDRDWLDRSAELAENLRRHHPDLCEKLIQRWIGTRVVYTQV